MSSESESDSSLDSIEQDELNKKLAKFKNVIDLMQKKAGTYKHEVRRLLEIGGNRRNSSSIFDRLKISPNIDLDKILEDESDLVGLNAVSPVHTQNSFKH